MDSRQQLRVASNQARCRRMNRGIKDALDRFHGDRGTQEFEIMCECALSECADMLEVPVGVYESARAHGSRFVVKPEHMMIAGERVVDRGPTWWMIEKTGVGRTFAEADIEAD
jgi:hypothetical protein